MEASVQKLYHGTLTSNLPTIRERGLVPRIGSTTAGYHVEAVDLDDFRRDLIGHAAVVIVPAAKFSLYPGHGIFDPSEASRHPPGAEPGDWYSRENVVIVGEMVGPAMLDWLHLTEFDFQHDYRELIGRRCS